MSFGPIQRLRQATPGQRRTLLAAALGWMLDSFDAMLYALVLAHIMRDFGMSKATAGLLYTLTLVASGIGGVLFGFIADRIGRKRALMLSILTYSICSFASGLTTGIVSLAVFRFILGLGMGGEWNTGATLVAETWPDARRAKAIGLVQSSWAIGFALAALVAGVVLRYANWRAVFFVGILPAALTLWIQNRVPESEMWKERQRGAVNSSRTVSTQQSNEDSFLQIFRPPYLKSTLTLLFLNFFGMFGWWADHLGRRRSFILYTFVAAALVPLYAMARSPAVLLILGTIVAFFGTGFFSGSGIVGSEIFPTRVRARALGFTYNGARTLSSLAPLTIGWVGQIKGLSWAFYLCAAAFLLASVMATQLPETKGKSLE